MRHFYYTNQWQDIEERTGTSTTMDKQYVWGIRYVDELICRDDTTPQRLYVCQDANFNVTAITDTSGSVVERYVFEPYGNRTAMDASWSVISYTAYEWAIAHQALMLDTESQLANNRSRYLHLTLGRYISRDFIRYFGGLNLFEYVGGRPSINLDPLGVSLTTAPATAPTPISLRPGIILPNFPTDKDALITGQDLINLAPTQIFGTQVTIGCVGVCRSLIGDGLDVGNPGTKGPQTSQWNNTTCYLTLDNAKSQQCKPPTCRKSIFAREGKWKGGNTPAQNPDGSVDVNSVVDNEPGSFNYATMLPSGQWVEVGQGTNTGVPADVRIRIANADPDSNSARAADEAAEKQRKYHAVLFCVKCVKPNQELGAP
jgi:RHS repeat-associated protein